MKPQLFSENQHIFLEGDEVNSTFFLVSGQAAFVLPSFANTNYIRISVGDKFGIIDITGSMQARSMKESEWFANRAVLYR